MARGRGWRALGLLAVWLAVGGAGAGAVPPLPASFWGTVTLDAAPVAVGTPVEVLVGGTPCAIAAVRWVEGRAVYTVHVPGDDPTTPEVEGGREGDALAFRVGGALYPQGAVWRGGTNTRLDLAAVSVRWAADGYLVEEGAGSVEVGVLLGAPWPVPLDVAYSSRAGSAGGGDYAPAEGILALGPGEREAGVLVEIHDDALDEGEESFTLALDPPVGVVGAAPQEARVRIRDDDPPPGVALERGAYRADPAAGAVEVGVVLDAPSGRGVSVGYATRDGTARAGREYLAAAGTLAWAPGGTRRSVTIALLGEAEGPLTFTLTLADPVHAVWGGAREAVVTLRRVPPLHLPLVRRG